MGQGVELEPLAERRLQRDEDEQNFGSRKSEGMLYSNEGGYHGTLSGPCLGELPD